MPAIMCNDNRFELIAKYKQQLIESTNIGTDKAEMAVIDNILFRLWQMGWLDKLEQLGIVRCKDCAFHEFYENHHSCEWHGFADVKPDWFCADGERRKEDAT